MSAECVDSNQPYPIQAVVTHIVATDHDGDNFPIIVEINPGVGFHLPHEVVGLPRKVSIKVHTIGRTRVLG